MLSVLPEFSLNYLKASLGLGISSACLPKGWADDKTLRNRVTERAANGSTFLKQMAILYDCMDRYNHGKKSFQQVHLVLDIDEELTISYELSGKGHYMNIEGFGFLTRGKIHTAYYTDMHEDLGFRVFEPGQNSHAYFRTYKATQEDFERFVDQAVFRRDKNPRLSF